MPLTLPEHVRREFSSRLMLQSPNGLTPRQMANIRADLDRMVDGLPGDVFMTLDALRYLAEQGNLVAKDMFDYEVQRLGLTRPFVSYRR